MRLPSCSGGNLNISPFESRIEKDGAGLPMSGCRGAILTQRVRTEVLLSQQDFRVKITLYLGIALAESHTDETALMMIDDRQKR